MSKNTNYNYRISIRFCVFGMMYRRSWKEYANKYTILQRAFSEHEDREGMDCET
jgi:hypothetical protein